MKCKCHVAHEHDTFPEWMIYMKYTRMNAVTFNGQVRDHIFIALFPTPHKRRPSWRERERERANTRNIIIFE